MIRARRRALGPLAVGALVLLQGCGAQTDPEGEERSSGDLPISGAERGELAVRSARDGVHPTALPNPYRTIRDWGEAPPGREWGRVSAVALDLDGRHLWVAERCGGDVCLGTDVPVVLRYAPDGSLLRSFGSGIFMRPHGIHVDSAGNVWVADVRSPRPGELEEHPEDADKGHQVVKFSREGEVLMILGSPGRAGDPPESLTQPNDVITTPGGDILVAEGHSNDGPVGRISRFSADGTFIETWGRFGSGPGEFRTPHALAFDSRGRLFVADRGNSRVQILGPDGSFLEEWDQFGRPNDVFISEDDVLLTVDAESGDERNPGFRRGVYIGSARDGSLTAFIPPHEMEGRPQGTAGEGIALDRDGDIYAGEVALGGMTKYVRER